VNAARRQALEAASDSDDASGGFMALDALKITMAEADELGWDGTLMHLDDVNPGSLAAFEKAKAARQQQTRDEILAPRPKVEPKGKVVRGTFYRGPKRDRSRDSRWDKTPTNIRIGVEEGQLTAIDMAVANMVNQNIERNRRSKKDKSQRITVHEIAAQLGLSTKTVQRSITRMVAAGELIVVSPGIHNLNGAIYAFPARQSEHEVGTRPRQSEHEVGTQSAEDLLASI